MKEENVEHRKKTLINAQRTSVYLSPKLIKMILEEYENTKARTISEVIRGLIIDGFKYRELERRLLSERLGSKKEES